MNAEPAITPAALPPDPRKMNHICVAKLVIDSEPQRAMNMDVVERIANEWDWLRAEAATVVPLGNGKLPGGRGPAPGPRPADRRPQGARCGASSCPPPKSASTARPSSDGPSPPGGAATRRSPSGCPASPAASPTRSPPEGAVRPRAACRPGPVIPHHRRRRCRLQDRPRSEEQPGDRCRAAGQGAHHHPHHVARPRPVLSTSRFDGRLHRRARVDRGPQPRHRRQADGQQAGLQAGHALDRRRAQHHLGTLHPRPGRRLDRRPPTTVACAPGTG